MQGVSPSRQCNYALPSHPTLLFSFRAQRASATLAFSNAKDTNTFSLCVQGVSPSRQCNYALPPHPTLLFSFRASVRQQRGITDIFCVCKKKKTGPANVFDYPQRVSFLFTFFPPAYLADLSNAKDTNTFSPWGLCAVGESIPSV